MDRMRAATTVFLLSVVGLAACGGESASELTSPPVSPTSTTPPADAAGAPLPTTPAWGTYLTAEVTGVFERVDDCVYLRSSDVDGRYVAVFPAGTMRQGDTIVLSGGEQLVIGEAVEGGGGWRPIPDESTDLPLDEIQACADNDTEGLVQFWTEESSAAAVNHD